MVKYSIRICDIPEEERPRNRLISKGASSLSDAELLSIVLRTGSKNENAINLAQRVLSQYNSKQFSQINIAQHVD
jgi:DNA repair protein RadC